MIVPPAGKRSRVSALLDLAFWRAVDPETRCGLYRQKNYQSDGRECDSSIGSAVPVCCSGESRCATSTTLAILDATLAPGQVLGRALTQIHVEERASRIS